MNTIEHAYTIAQEQYSSIGVDTEAAIKRLGGIALSLHCWQGDDLGGFEHPDSALSGGGIQATGNYPDRARSARELQKDIEKTLSLIPGTHRVNLHAIYGEWGDKPVERTKIEPRHFSGWLEWAKKRHLALDFNATCFSHPLAEKGFTLSSRDEGIRAFWIEHVRAARSIAAHFGKEQGSPAVHNLWIPDGYKDVPVDRFAHRALLKESLDTIYRLEYPRTRCIDAVESKLFGIGSESCVIGSHEFYLGYALAKGIMVCLDMGHFHPTESVADKISSILQFSDQLLLHISRGVRWDSDHVPVLNDELTLLAQEIVRSKSERRVHFATDFFDASINRIMAWVIGGRALLKSLLAAMLEPTDLLVHAEQTGDYGLRLALLEETKTMPAGAVWDYYCEMNHVPASMRWIDEVKAYERETLSKR